jgi:hypothetical protein
MSHRFSQATSSPRRQPPGLIVCERRVAWTPLLRRDLAPQVPVLPTGSLDHCWEELQQRTGSAVMLQVTESNWRRVAKWVVQARDFDPRTICLAAMPRRLAAVTDLLRHVGVIHTLRSPLDLPAALRLIQRHVQRQPPPRLSLEEQIWNNLPWRP